MEILLEKCGNIMTYLQSISEYFVFYEIFEEEKNGLL